MTREEFSRKEDEPIPVFGRLLRDIGFPIFVALYLLMQVNPVLVTLRETLVSLTRSQEVLIAQQRELINEIRRTRQ